MSHAEGASAATDSGDAQPDRDLDERAKLRVEALLKEYEFVETLVPLYRGFEMTAVQLSVVIFAAAIGFGATALQRGDARLVYFLGAVLSFPLSMLLLAMVGMEVRIIRASRHVQHAIAPRLNELLGTGLDVLTWESAPGRHLSPKEKKYQGTWVYASVIAAEGFAGATTAFVGAVRDPSARWWLCAITAAGLSLLLCAAGLLNRISSGHEGRDLGPAVPANR